MYRNELPDTCLSVLASTGQLIIIKNGEHGYYPSDWETGNKAQNREIADFHNRKRGISDFQETAMIAGSMFGWNLPIANPQCYLDTARYVNSTMMAGHIKDPVMSVMYPIRGSCLCYEIGGRQRTYFSLDALPKELMGCQSQFVMLPDLVGGTPMMPVEVSYGSNGTCTIKLEHGSYTAEKEINAEYQIIAKVRVGNAEFTIGEHPKAPDQFVTWERNCKNDADGPPNYFWGHYGNDRAAMVEDFCNRAKEEHKPVMQSRQRNNEKQRGEAR